MIVAMQWRENFGRYGEVRRPNPEQWPAFYAWALAISDPSNSASAGLREAIGLKVRDARLWNTLRALDSTTRTGATFITEVMSEKNLTAQNLQVLVDIWMAGVPGRCPWMVPLLTCSPQMTHTVARAVLLVGMAGSAKTGVELAAKLGKSKERTRQLVEKAIRTLRQAEITQVTQREGKLAVRVRLVMESIPESVIKAATETLSQSAPETAEL